MKALDPASVAKDRGYSKRASDPIADGTTLRATRQSLFLLAGCLVFFVMVGYASFRMSEGRSAVVYGAFWSAWVVLAVVGLLDGWIARYDVQAEGFVFRSLFSGSGSMAWSDIAKIEHSMAFDGFVTIRSKNRRVVRVAFERTGMTELAHVLLQRCASAEIAPATREVLERLAMGEQRPIWGLRAE